MTEHYKSNIQTIQTAINLTKQTKIKYTNTVFSASPKDVVQLHTPNQHTVNIYVLYDTIL